KRLKPLSDNTSYFLLFTSYFREAVLGTSYFLSFRRVLGGLSPKGINYELRITNYELYFPVYNCLGGKFPSNFC
ncbi:MAG: hypothetical protein AAF063_16640, partial [Cyanobacteria bacterium J06643_5]